MQAVKQVQVIERQDKGNGYILYIVKSSDGKGVYATTIHNGIATNCTCPAKKSTPCYHRIQLQEAEKATLPLLNTPEAKEIVHDMASIFATKKTRRSADNELLIAQLQVKVKVSIATVRKAMPKRPAPIKPVALPQAA